MLLADQGLADERCLGARLLAGGGDEGRIDDADDEVGLVLLDVLGDLLVALVAHVDAVDLDDALVLAQAGLVRRRVGVDRVDGAVGREADAQALVARNEHDAMVGDVLVLVGNVELDELAGALEAGSRRRRLLRRSALAQVGREVADHEQVDLSRIGRDLVDDGVVLHAVDGDVVHFEYVVAVAQARASRRIARAHVVGDVLALVLERLEVEAVLVVARRSHQAAQARHGHVYWRQERRRRLDFLDVFARWLAHVRLGWSLDDRRRLRLRLRLWRGRTLVVGEASGRLGRLHELGPERRVEHGDVGEVAAVVAVLDGLDDVLEALEVGVDVGAVDGDHALAVAHAGLFGGRL